MARYDVVVVGGGIAGSELASVRSAAGTDVLVLEKPSAKHRCSRLEGSFGDDIVDLCGLGRSERKSGANVHLSGSSPLQSVLTPSAARGQLASSTSSKSLSDGPSTQQPAEKTPYASARS